MCEGDDVGKKEKEKVNVEGLGNRWKGCQDKKRAGEITAMLDHFIIIINIVIMCVLFSFACLFVCLITLKENIGTEAIRL